VAKLSLEIGKRAEKAYYMEFPGISLSSIEELCYYICVYADYMGRDMIGEELICWIDKECGLYELSMHLSSLYRQNCSLQSFLGFTLEYVHFCDKDRIALIETCIRENQQIKASLLNKKRADYYVQVKKYHRAFELYYKLIETNLSGDHQFLANIYYNLAIVCIRLFYFDLADDYFLKAYQLFPDRNTLIARIKLKRLSEPQKEFYIEGYLEEELKEQIMEVDAFIEQVSEQFVQSREMQVIKDAFDKKKNLEMAEYYLAVREIVNDLKEDYNNQATL